MNDHELLRIYDFIDKIRSPFSEINDADDEAGWRIVSYLLRSELQGYPVTMTKLAMVSGLSHGSAIRRITQMIEGGDIVRRAIAGSTKSFSLHPSPELIDKSVKYARKTKAMIAESLGARRAKENEANYYFGGPARTTLIPPVNLMQSRIESGVELSFLLNDDNYFDAMRNMWVDFRNNLASAENFHLVRQSDLYRIGLENGAKPISDYDLIAIDMPWLGEFATKGLLMPLGDRIREAGISPMDFHPSIWSTTTWRGIEYGVPIYCTIEILAARSDLFEGDGISYPKTFDEVIAAGRHFHDPANGRFGISWNGARGMPIASSFMFFMGCCGASVLSIRRTPTGFSTENLDRQHMQPQLDTDVSLSVLDYMHRLLEIAPPDTLRADWDDSFAHFFSGKCSMSYVWTMRAARFEADVRSAVKRRVKFLPQAAGPRGGQTSPIGGFLLAIPANIDPSRKEMATEALAWMTSREAMKAHVQNGIPIAPRFSVSADPETSGRSQLVSFVGNLANRNLLRNWQRPPVPFYTQMEAVLGEEIHAALSGEKSDKAALVSAQDRIARAIQEA